MSEESRLAQELDRAYAASRDEALAHAGLRSLPGGFLPRLPPSIRNTMVACAALEPDGGCPKELALHYLDKSPRMLVAQFAAAQEPATQLLSRPLARAGSMRAALDAALGLLRSEGLPAPFLLGAPSAEALLADNSAASLAPRALLACGLPILGAYPAERAATQLELAARDPDDVLDERLGGRLVHELLHGPLAETDALPPPWLVQEAAALHLGACAHARHVFPEVAGEALPGVSLFVLAGQGVARVLGRAALWSALTEPLQWRSRVGPRVANALDLFAFQQWLARRAPPFARDALDAEEQVKLADLTRALARADAPDERAHPLHAVLDRLDAISPLAAARTFAPLLPQLTALPWSALPWWREEPQPADRELLDTGVRALFQENALGACFITRPSELPQGRLRVEVEACRLSAQARTSGVFGEPARWIFPPPLARRLFERGARVLEVEGARRDSIGAIAAALWGLSMGSEALPGSVSLAL